MVTVSEIQKILNDAGISGEVEHGSIPQLIAVTIYWGDWKHDHGYLKDLMPKQGLTQVNEELVEEYGSDCYSAKHTFGEDHFVEGARKLFQLHERTTLAG